MGDIAITIRAGTPDAESYLPRLAAVLDSFTPHERQHLATHGVSIHITPDPLPAKQGNYDPHGRTALLSTATPEQFQLPPCIVPLFSDFEYCAVHELTHPLLERARLTPASRLRLAGLAEEALDRARAAEPEAVRRTEDAFRQFLLHNDTSAIFALEFPLREMPVETLAALYVGIFANPEFYGCYGYKPELHLAEMACNLRSLAKTLGEGPVRVFAGEFLDAIETRLHDLPADAPSPPPPARATAEALRYTLAAAPGAPGRRL